MARSRGGNRRRGTGCGGQGVRGNLATVSKAKRGRGTSTSSEGRTRAQANARAALSSANSVTVTADIHTQPHSQGGTHHQISQEGPGEEIQVIPDDGGEDGAATVSGEADCLLAGPIGPSGESLHLGFNRPNAGASTASVVTLVGNTSTVNTERFQTPSVYKGPIIANIPQINSQNISRPLHVAQGTTGQHSQSMSIGTQGQEGANNHNFSGSLPFNMNVSQSLGQSGQSGISNPSSLVYNLANSSQYSGYSMPNRDGVCGRLGGTSSSIGLGGVQLSNAGCSINTVGSSSMLGSINCIAGSGSIPMVNSIPHLSLPSTPFNPLISVCSELGEGLPLTLKSKIINSEYVEFAVILEKSEPSTSSGQDMKEFSLVVNEGGLYHMER